MSDTKKAMAKAKEVFDRLHVLVARAEEIEAKRAELQAARVREVAHGADNGSTLPAQIAELNRELDEVSGAVELLGEEHKEAVRAVLKAQAAEGQEEYQRAAMRQEELKGKAYEAFMAYQKAVAESQEQDALTTSLAYKTTPRPEVNQVEGTLDEIRAILRENPLCVLDSRSFEATVRRLSEKQQREGFPATGLGQRNHRDLIMRDGGKAYLATPGRVRVMWDRATGQVIQSEVIEVWRVEATGKPNAKGVIMSVPLPGARPEPVPQKRIPGQAVTPGFHKDGERLVAPPGFHRGADPDPHNPSPSAQVPREIVNLEAQKAAIAVRLAEAKERQRIAKAVEKVKKQEE